MEYTHLVYMSGIYHVSNKWVCSVPVTLLDRQGIHQAYAWHMPGVCQVYVVTWQVRNKPIYWKHGIYLTYTPDVYIPWIYLANTWYIPGIWNVINLYTWYIPGIWNVINLYTRYIPGIWNYWYVLGIYLVYTTGHPWRPSPRPKQRRRLRSSWQSGSPRTWLTSWVCQTPATSGLLRSWTSFLLAVWFQTVGAITCTPFTLLSLNQICIEELCVHCVIRSTWPSIAFVARMLRWVHYFWFDAIMSYTIHMTNIW
jgi:hypothetical protein